MTALDIAAQHFSTIAIIGPTNAGKSTLLNRILRQKVAIVTPKVQTTRSRITGILTEAPHQLVFIDTPGLFAPKKLLDRAMLKAAWDSLEMADIALFTVDASKDISLLEGFIRQLNQAKEHGLVPPVWLVLNQVDKVKQKEKLLLLAQSLSQQVQADQVFMISSTKQNGGVENLVQSLKKASKPHPWAHDEEEITTLPNKLFAAEITREALMFAMQNELPYVLSVETEQWEERTTPSLSIHISQVILVKTEGQKAIIVGKGGQSIKAIGQRSREQLSKLYEMPVHLKLFVKLAPKWDERSENLAEIGLH